eukprot:g11553.t1
MGLLRPARGPEATAPRVAMASGKMRITLHIETLGGASFQVPCTLDERLVDVKQYISRYSETNRSTPSDRRVEELAWIQTETFDSYSLFNLGILDGDTATLCYVRHCGQCEGPCCCVECHGLGLRTTCETCGLQRNCDACGGPCRCPKCHGRPGANDLLFCDVRTARHPGASGASVGGVRTTRSDRDNGPQELGVSYDAHVVNIGVGEQFSSGFVGANPNSKIPEAQIQAENRKLREAMRFLLNKVAPTDEEKEQIPEDVKELVRIDPREQLRLRQKELNEERKQLTKLEKAKDSLDKKSKNFQSWKETVETGIRSEEKRHSTELAEISAEIKSLERQRDGIEPIQVDTDEEDDAGIREENKRLHKEISGLKADLREVAAYTTQLDKKNGMMMEQMSHQLQTIMSCFQSLAPMGPMLEWSPQQRVHARGTIAEEIKRNGPKQVETKKEDRSRSPARRSGEDQDAEPVWPEEAVDTAGEVVDEAEIKAFLSGLPEEIQMQFIQLREGEPERYQTRSEIQYLMAYVMEQEKQARGSASGTEKSVPLPLTDLQDSDHRPVARNVASMHPIGVAMMLYLAEKCQAFYPSNPRERCECLQWLFWQVGGQGPMTGNFGHFKVYAPSHEVDARNYGVARYGMEVQRLCSVLDRHLAGHGDFSGDTKKPGTSSRAYLVGDQYSIADMACFPWAYMLWGKGYNRPDQYFDDRPPSVRDPVTELDDFLGLEKYVHLKAWVDRIAARPAVQRGIRVCCLSCSMKDALKPAHACARHVKLVIFKVSSLRMSCARQISQSARGYHHRFRHVSTRRSCSAGVCRPAKVKGKLRLRNQRKSIPQRVPPAQKARTQRRQRRRKRHLPKLRKHASHSGQTLQEHLTLEDAGIDYDDFVQASSSDSASQGSVCQEHQHSCCCADLSLSLAAPSRGKDAKVKDRQSG